MNIYEKRRFMAGIKNELPRLGLRDKRMLIAHYDELADEVERLQRENAALTHWRDLYAALATDWNAVCAATEAAGIEVVYPSYSDFWHWHCPDGTTGTAPTAGEATAAALRHMLSNVERKT